MEPPIIRFSQDGSLAYTTVHKEVIIQYQKQAGEEVREKTKFAWLAIYVKEGQTWKMEAMASTNKASEFL